ncbi:MAG: hypothetical protein F6K09_01430 [Merismopedia sp. SIO2A8]|nr:hypothetical protein [Merismopedia sp. SIO2A8]
MVDLTQESQVQKTIIRLLNDYSFDSGDRPIAFVIADWFGNYPSRWIMGAVIEALYQGRYKTISVEQILIIWQRRGTPLYHFNHEFERIVCNRLWEKVDVAEPVAEDRKETGRMNTEVMNTGVINTESMDTGIVGEANNVFPPITVSQPIAVYSQDTDLAATTNPPSLRTEATSFSDSPSMLGHASTSDIPQSSPPLEFELAWTPRSVNHGQDSEGKTTNREVVEQVLVPASVALASAPNPLPSPTSGTAARVDTQSRGNIATTSRSLQPWNEKSRPLQPFDPNQHKVPLPSFKPEHPLNQKGDHWQHWSGQAIRHCPIHQFQPDKAPLIAHNKLKAIARFGNVVHPQYSS